MKLFKPITVTSDQMLNFDAMRFMGAATVVFFHSTHYLELAHPFNEENFAGVKFLVDLFFIISGYVLAAIYTGRLNTQSQVLRFFKTRWARLYPLHLLVFLAFLLISIVGAGQSNHPENYDPRCIPANLLLVQAWGGCSHMSYNFPSWSVSAEMMMYVLFPALLWLSVRSRLTVLALGFISLTVISAATRASPEPWFFWTAPFGVVRAFPSFLLGLSLWSYRDLTVKIPYPQHVLWGLILTYVISNVLHWPVGLDLLLIYMIAIVSTAADTLKTADPFMRWLAPLGNLTYASYMMHSLIMLLLVTVVADKLLHLHGWPKNLMIGFSMVMVFVLSWPIENLCDEIKARLLARPQIKAPVKEMLSAG